MPSSPGHLMPIGVRRVRKATRAQEWRIMLNVITLSQHEKANLTLPLGSGLPRGIHWHLHVNGDTHLGCNRRWLPVLGVHADGDAWWVGRQSTYGEKLYTRCAVFCPQGGSRGRTCVSIRYAAVFSPTWRYVKTTLENTCIWRLICPIRHPPMSSSINLKLLMYE